MTDHATAQQIPFGRTGLTVSELALGTMNFGPEADEAESAAIYRAARDRGITLIDTADLYGGGASEQILGRLIAGHRDEVVIASKAFWPTGPGANDRGLGRRHLVDAVNASLTRLGTDRLDVLFVHDLDPVTPIEETMRTLDDLVRIGKILYVGVSNWLAWRIATANGIADARGWTRFSVIEPMYSLAKRQAEVEILPLAQYAGMAVISYSPLGGGLLTGKYRANARPATGRLVENARYVDRYAGDFQLAEDYTAFCEAEGLAPVATAIAWVRRHPGITAPIIAGRSAAQLEGSLAALDVTMDDDLYARISALTPTPAPATDRTETLKEQWR